MSSMFAIIFKSLLNYKEFSEFTALIPNFSHLIYWMNNNIHIVKIIKVFPVDIIFPIPAPIYPFPTLFSVPQIPNFHIEANSWRRYRYICNVQTYVSISIVCAYNLNFIWNSFSVLLFKILAIFPQKCLIFFSCFS